MGGVRWTQVEERLTEGGPRRSYEGRIGLKTEAVNWRLELRERREDLTQRAVKREPGSKDTLWIMIWTQRRTGDEGLESRELRREDQISETLKRRLESRSCCNGGRRLESEGRL